MASEAHHVVWQHCHVSELLWVRHRLVLSGHLDWPPCLAGAEGKLGRNASIGVSKAIWCARRSIMSNCTILDYCYYVDYQPNATSFYLHFPTVMGKLYSILI